MGKVQPVERTDLVIKHQIVSIIDIMLPFKNEDSIQASDMEKFAKYEAAILVVYPCHNW